MSSLCRSIRASRRYKLAAKDTVIVPLSSTNAGRIDGNTLTSCAEPVSSSRGILNSQPNLMEKEGKRGDLPSDMHVQCRQYLCRARDVELRQFLLQAPQHLFLLFDIAFSFTARLPVIRFQFIETRAYQILTL